MFITTLKIQQKRDLRGWKCKFPDISHNMNLLMVALASKLRPFRDDGGSNSEIRLEGKLGDQEDSGKESWKEYEKEKLSSSAMNPSQSLFNMEVKVDIKPLGWRVIL
jgi:hypothetical protein